MPVEHAAVVSSLGVGRSVLLATGEQSLLLIASSHEKESNLKASLMRAFGGGISGASAMAIQVWLMPQWATDGLTVYRSARCCG